MATLTPPKKLPQDYCRAPFAFVYTEGKFYWVIGESLGTAIVYFVIGMGCWVAYLITLYKTRIL